MTKKIQSYELIESISAGEGDVIWKARHTSTGEIVTITSLPPQFTIDPDFSRRFLDDSEILYKLNHKNIVRVIEFLEEEASLHLVTEFTEGRKLKEMIGKKVGPIPLNKAVHLIIQILEGIKFAHQQGVVHQGLNPSKIFVTEEGIIKIADFGFARYEGLLRLNKGEKKREALFYKSPENLRGEPVTEQFDIYSAGIILYEMLAGELPFDQSGKLNDFKLMNKIMSEKLEDPCQFCSDIPEWLVNVIYKATSKEKSVRLKTADDFIKLLKSEKETAEKEAAERETAERESAKKTPKKQTAEKQSAHAFEEKAPVNDKRDFENKIKSLKEIVKEKKGKREFEKQNLAQSNTKTQGKGRGGRKPKKKGKFAAWFFIFLIAIASATYYYFFVDKNVEVIWMEQNLDVDHYRNGDSILQVKDPRAWAKLKTGAWCYYENDPLNGGKYGKLYNWYAVNDERGLAPTSWRIPTQTEFETLKSSIQIKNKSAKNDEEEISTKTNSLTLFPGGCCDSTGYFYDLDYVPYYWSSTEQDSLSANNLVLLYHDKDVSIKKSSKKYGYSVRCLKEKEK